MRFTYPLFRPEDHPSDEQTALRIARHSPCTVCVDCSGLRPSPDDELVDDLPVTSIGGLGQYGSDDEDDDPYLDTCSCGHGVTTHGADLLLLGREEFARLGRVASRLDELLQDARKLLNFDYTDSDIESLRKQMRSAVSSIMPPHPATPIQSSAPNSPATSELSDLPPPKKKRRISMSSLSNNTDAEDDEDDDEEDRPLAARMADQTNSRAPAGYRSAMKGPSSQRGMASKKGPSSVSSMKGPSNKGVMGQRAQKARTGPSESPSKVNGETKVKLEDKMDDAQLDKLASGATVDAVTETSSVKKEKASAVELRKGVIQVTAVERDGTERCDVILTNLKTLFQKQLPKMPREYIARLVFDSNSKSLAIIKHGYKVVGGICYRPFPHRGFAEIVFFATSSVDQVKGYGAMLMDHFKMHIRTAYPGMMHFLTYADNYAVGYFEKQGFSKEITLDRSVWAGYIKDYEGGTIMQCTMLRKVDYLNKSTIISAQQDAILSKIAALSRSHIIYPGLTLFSDGQEPSTPIDPKQIPGLAESGWSADMMINPAAMAGKNSDRYFMERVLKDLQNHPQSWAFLTAVNKDDAADYYDWIKHPMDFGTMEHKLENKQYATVDAFVADAQLIFDNARYYNQEGSIYVKNAKQLEKCLRGHLAERRKQEG